MKEPRIPGDLVWSPGPVPPCEEFPPFAMVLRWHAGDGKYSPSVEQISEGEFEDARVWVEDRDRLTSDWTTPERAAGYQEEVRKCDFWAFVGVYDRLEAP